MSALAAVGGAIGQHVLAQNNFGDTESDGLAGPVGLLIILLLAVGTVLLVRNMNGHLKRLPQSFPVPGTESKDGSGSTPGTDGPIEAGNVQDASRDNPAATA
jgi:hypothetical protein